MTSEMALFIGKRTLETAMLLSAPILIVTLVVGLGTSVLQAVTSIRDMTLGMVLKLACVGVVLLVFGNWMLHIAVGFTAEIFNQIQAVGH